MRPPKHEDGPADGDIPKALIIYTVGVPVTLLFLPILLLTVGALGVSLFTGEIFHQIRDPGEARILLGEICFTLGFAGFWLWAGTDMKAASKRRIAFITFSVLIGVALPFLSGVGDLLTAKGESWWFQAYMTAVGLTGAGITLSGLKHLARRSA